MKIIILSFLSSISFAANESSNSPLPAAVENQCRIEAKEIALKSYQSCVSTKKAEQLNLLRKEYQVRMNDLKNEYDQKIKSLVAKPEVSTKPKVSLKNLINEPTVKLKKASKKKSKNGQVQDPTIITETEFAESQSLAIESNEVTGEVEKLEMEDTSLSTY